MKEESQKYYVGAVKGDSVINLEFAGTVPATKEGIESLLGTVSAAVQMEQVPLSVTCSLTAGFALNASEELLFVWADELSAVEALVSVHLALKGLVKVGA